MLGGTVNCDPRKSSLGNEDSHTLFIPVVPHVRITKLHCYFKHSVFCIGQGPGLGLRLGNIIIIAIHGPFLHDSLYEESTIYSYSFQSIPGVAEIWITCF